MTYEAMKELLGISELYTVTREQIISKSQLKLGFWTRLLQSSMD